MYKIDQLTEIDLGVVQENEATEIQIDVSPWLKKWPDGIFAVNVCRPGEMEPYPANCRVEDGMLYWLVTEGELAIAGNGRCDIRLYQGTVKKKTRIAITRIHETLPGSTQEAPPDAAQGWLDSLNETRAEVESNAKAAKESAEQAALSEVQAMALAQSAAESANAAETAKESAETAWQNIQALDAEAETLAPEEAATVEFNKALNKLLFGIPKGNKGDKGDQGVSPMVTVSKTGKVTTVTITDKDGTKTFYINDGMDGEGAGDMLKSTYDADGDGVVDKAESATYATNAGIASRANSAASADTAHSATNATNATNAANASKLGGELPSAYRKKEDQIDYLTEVQNKPTIPTVETAVTAGSANAVSGGAVKTYVDGKETALQTGIDARPTMEELLIAFPTDGWMQDVSAGVWFQTVSVDAYGNALDLNDATDKLFVDVKIPNLNKDEVREAWAELRDFQITEDGLRANFFEQPTVNITIDAVRFRKEG